MSLCTRAVYIYIAIPFFRWRKIRKITRSGKEREREKMTCLIGIRLPDCSIIRSSKSGTTQFLTTKSVFFGPCKLRSSLSRDRTVECIDLISNKLSRRCIESIIIVVLNFPDRVSTQERRGIYIYKFSRTIEQIFPLSTEIIIS